MNYEQAREKLPLHADGELDPETAAAVEAHLAKSAELRDELERWRALRHCANRAVLGTPVPPELENTVRAELQRARVAGRRRPLKLFGGVTAIAAAVVLMLAWLLSGPFAERSTTPVLVDAETFARVYRRCAVKHAHNTFVNVDLHHPAVAREALASLKAYPVLLPDLRDRGFQLVGICECFNCPDVEVVHAHYRHDGPEPEIVSLFSANRRVNLRNARHRTGACPNGRRDYQIAESATVRVWKWDESKTSFAVCSEMDSDQLQDLAEGVRVARSRGYYLTLALKE